MTKQNTLTLRDQFAMEAMGALIVTKATTNKDALARDAYGFANAMMAERIRHVTNADMPGHEEPPLDINRRGPSQVVRSR